MANAALGIGFSSSNRDEVRWCSASIEKTCESIPDKASRKAAETERAPSVRLEKRTVKGALARAIDGRSIEARNGQLKCWSSKHV